MEKSPIVITVIKLEERMRTFYQEVSNDEETFSHRFNIEYRIRYNDLKMKIDLLDFRGHKNLVEFLDWFQNCGADL